jgi:SNF2 family DNA or RNA helicase
VDAPLFTFRTEPLSHQRALFNETRDHRAYGIFWEQGTGKTKAAIDLAAYLYLSGRVDAVLVVAPTGIHSNWDVPGEGIQKHLTEELLKAAARMIWHSNKTGTKGHIKAFDYLIKHKTGMRWLFMGFDALNTKKGYAAAEQFLRTYRCLWVMDEAARIKNPQAARTKAAMKLRPLAPYRRPMTGTPTAQKPFDVYALVRWMDPTYWTNNGFASFLGFKHYFGEWRRIKVAGGREVEVQRTDNDNKPIYKNLDELARLLRPVSSRVLKSDVLDLPEKVYTSVYYDLTAKQRELYDKLEREYILWYEQNSKPDEEDPDKRVLTTSADLAIVRQLRLQQLALGYLVSDEGDYTQLPENPALDLLEELVADIPHPAIIWGRFRKDIELIMAKLGDRAVRYDGTTAAEDRTQAVQAFQGGKVQFFVATPATAGEGLTLTAAQTTIYYSNSRKLVERQQSEDRNHRIGQTKSVQYLDILGRNTIAEDILTMLRYNEDVAAAALGDRIRRRHNG